MPWRDRHFSPEGKFPRCVGYVKAMGVRTNDPGLTDYWLACLAAEAFTDEELVEAGTVDFNTMRGPHLLSALEARFRAGTKRKREYLGSDQMESLKAFFGSRGVKASALKTADDFWLVGHILWPTFVKRPSGESLADLHAILRSMTKKQRQSARENMRQVPDRFLPRRAA